MRKRVTRDVPIPAGVDDGVRLRVTGEGEPSPEGGARGDCYVFIKVKPHPFFQRHEKHLLCQVPISYTQAALALVWRSRPSMDEPSWRSPAERKAGPISPSGVAGCPSRVPARAVI